jgi:molecular chaperone IbpA
MTNQHGSVKGYPLPLIDDFFKMNVGYGDLFKKIDEVAQNAQKYPPHDIIRLSETEYLINLAVAGFSKEHLSITEKDNNLIISGEIPKDIPVQSDSGDIHPNPHYVYKGISTRSFSKKFTIAENMTIKGATFKDGILSISFSKNIPEVVEKKINIE